MAQKILKQKQKWINVEYNCSNQTISSKLINKMVNRLWLENFKEINEKEKYLILMFRVRLAETRDIKTITKLQKLRFSSKEFLKSYLDLKSFLLKEVYSDLPISSIIFSFGFRDFLKLKDDFIDTVAKEIEPVKNENLFHYFKNYKLPLNTDFNKLGKIITENDSFKLIVLDNKTNLAVKIENREDGFNYYLIDYIKNNKVKISWVDKIINIEDDHLIRTISQTIVEYKNGDILSIRNIKKCNKIQKINTPRTISKNIITADLETYLDENNNMVPYLASFYQQGNMGYFFNNNTNILFQNFFKKLFCRKNRGFKIYFHNLSGFDGFFLIKYLIKFGYNISPLIHSDKLISINISQGRNYWYLRDSNLLLLQSLNKLCKSFNIDSVKGNFPYFLKDINYKGPFPEYKYFNTNKLSIQDYIKESKEFGANQIWSFKERSINYCLNDSKVLFEILVKFNNLIFDKFSININKYPTIPSLAFAIYRSKYLDKDIPIIKGSIKKDIQLSYTGGSTDMFIPSLNVLFPSNKKIYAYDINSLYPYVMLSNEYPIGDPIYIEYPNPLTLKKETNIFGFFYAKIITPINLSYPILQNHFNNSTISPIGSFEGWFFSEELKNALNFGYKISILKGYLFEKGKIFEGYVNDLYKMRLSYPKSDPMNYISKLLLNSLYGRFGMTDLFSEIITISKYEFEK